MGQKVFIPITDEILYEYPELITTLRPYQVDNPCFHWLATIESPEEGDKPSIPLKQFNHRMPLDRGTAQIGSRLA